MIQTFTYDRSLISGRKPGEAFIMPLPIFASAESRKSGRLRPKGRLRGALCLAAVLLAILSVPAAHAQKAAIKTNILSDALLNPNLAAEFALAPRWTLDVSGEFNVWNLSHDRKWKHWVASARNPLLALRPFRLAISSKNISSEGNTTSGDRHSTIFSWHRLQKA